MGFRLKMTARVPALIITLVCVISCAAADHICFSNPQHKEEMLCYAYKKYPKKDAITLQAAIKLFSSIENPGSIVTLSGEMRQRYSNEKFLERLSRYFTGLSEKDISLIISTENTSAVYLHNGSTLYYDHNDSAFIFSYDTPIALVGAAEYYVHGFKPKLTQVVRDASACNLERDGVLFLSPQKESFYYKKDSTFCSYNGMAYLNKNKKTYAWPIVQLEKSGSTNQHVSFSAFLMWLKNAED